MTIFERFNRKIDTSRDCWLWTGAKDKDGYGVFWVNEKRRADRAHRVSVELYGGDIPDGLQLDHLCRNRACVRPDHLQAVTGAMNKLWNERNRS